MGKLLSVKCRNHQCEKEQLHQVMDDDWFESVLPFVCEFCGSDDDDFALTEKSETARVRAFGLKRCSECRDSEHSNFDDDVDLVVVKDPETGKLVKRAYLCSEHVYMNLTDGYALYINGSQV